MYAIFGGGKPIHTPSLRKAYSFWSYQDLTIMQVHLVEAMKSYPGNASISITFTQDEAKRLSQPHYDALVLNLEIAKHQVMRNLIDGGSSKNIIFTRAFSQLNILDKTLKPWQTLFRALLEMR